MSKGTRRLWPNWAAWTRARTRKTRTKTRAVRRRSPSRRARRNPSLKPRGQRPLPTPRHLVADTTVLVSAPVAIRSWLEPTLGPYWLGAPKPVEAARRNHRARGKSRFPRPWTMPVPCATTRLIASSSLSATFRPRKRLSRKPRADLPSVFSIPFSADTCFSFLFWSFFFLFLIYLLDRLIRFRCNSRIHINRILTILRWFVQYIISYSCCNSSNLCNCATLQLVLTTGKEGKRQRAYWDIKTSYSLISLQWLIRGFFSYLRLKIKKGYTIHYRDKES